MKSRAGVVEVDVTVGCGQMAENRAESQLGVMASFVTPLTQACLSYPSRLLSPSLDNPLLLDHPPLATHLPLYNRLGRCVKGKKSNTSRLCNWLVGGNEVREVQCGGDFWSD